jgi:hypothetical protein
VKMALLFSSSEYTDIVLVLCWRMVKCAGVLLEPRELERVENATTTIRNNRGMMERVENHFVGAFIIVLTITAVTLNTSCND